MLLYTRHNSPRLSYIAAFIGGELFNEGIYITTDLDFFNDYAQPKINYTEDAFSDGSFHVEPVSLLFETSIRDQEIECSMVDFKQAFFLTGGDFAFDIFAAAFYLLSRYEEYLPSDPDHYGRFAHSASLAFREGFLDIPLINYWLQDFKKAVLFKFPGIIFRMNDFRFIPTYDIDIAYSYRFKGFLRNTGGLFRSLFKGEWAKAADRLMVLFRGHRDPYDSYEWLDALHLYCRTRAYYFFLVAGRTNAFDKNLSPSKKGMRSLIGYHAKGYTVGIHPSWQSGDDERLLQTEIDFLESIVQNKILNSRQHYIRMQLPHTYRRLLKAGIERDFSMGYGTANGFRASVASSFYWYDLEAESQTNLTIFPFCFMDANAFYQKQLTPSKAFNELMHYYRTIKKVNGLMLTLWHNEFFGTDPLFSGWKEVYEIFLKEEVYWDM